METTPTTQPSADVQPVAAAPSTRPSRRQKDEGPLEPLDDVLRRRLTTIKEGDNVLLKLPSDSIKAVVASKEGLVNLGKFGAFPARELLGLPYDIEYEIAAGPDAPATTSMAMSDEQNDGDAQFGQGKSKKQKKQGKAGAADAAKNNPGWSNILRPLKRRPIVDAVIDDIKETNEFIEDTEDKGNSLLSQDEIEELRAQGVSAEEMMKRQMARHGQFELKTDFSKEKWRKRKEKKYLQTVQPMAPSSINIVNHYAVRSPQSILHLREDTLSQILTFANIRPGGRYLVVDDTGGLVTAAIADRMGCEGRILLFTDADSPPAWGVLNVMNFGERELSCIKWVNWMEADEDYARPAPPAEDDMPAIASTKTMARLRRHNHQVADLNATRKELHAGNWDSIILATEMLPTSIIARLTKYLAGSGTLVAYSPYQQILAEALQYTRKDPNFLATALTESWTRTYQVLPGRTHPTMTTSAMGGYLLTATRVIPSTFVPESHQRHNNKRRKKNTGEAAAVEAARGEEE